MTDAPPDILTDEEVDLIAAQLLLRIGARIRQFRNMQELRPREIYERFGFDQGQLSRFENGKQNISPRALVQLAFVFNVHPWDFYMLDAEMRGFNPMPQTNPMPSKEDFLEARNEYQQQIGARIRALRELQGMSQDALEAVSGIGVSTLPKLERGRSAFPTTTAIRIADGLGVRTRELYIPAERSRIRIKRRRR